MRKVIGKPQVLKEVNSSLIQQLIYDQGPISKPGLSRISGLSLPTVNKLVEELEEQSFISQVGLTGTGAGRKAMLYEANKNAGCFLAFYYNWGEFHSCIADMTGKIVYEQVYPFDKSSMSSTLDSITCAIDDLMKKAPSKVKAIGVGVPGAVLPDGRLLGIPKIEVWEGFNLQKELSRRYGADICVENDVKLSAVGYYRTYVSDRLDNMVYIYAGNGVGSGIILNKRLFRGSSHFSGELGFMAPLGREASNKDYTIVGGYLEQLLREFVRSELNNFKESEDPKQRGQMANILGAAAANYIAVLNPDAIVFGGETFDGILIKAIGANVQNYTPSSSMPELLFDSSNKSGINGLVITCREEITTRTQLIHELGV